MELQPLRVKHTVNIGDLVAAMGSIKKFSEISGHKMIVSQQIGLRGQYYQGATHPTRDDEDENVMVCCNSRMWEMVKPLIESQEYVHSFEKYDGQKLDLDLGEIRDKIFVNLPHGAIQNWISMAFPDLAFDLSQPWIKIEGECPAHVKEQIEGKIIVNFTERYRNETREYFFLKQYEKDLVFAGTEREWSVFITKWQINIPRLTTSDFLEYAYAIRDCRFFLGNQSFGWNLAEAMKTPRILEMCNYAANCVPGVGADSFGYFHQHGLEYYVRKLYDKYK